MRHVALFTTPPLLFICCFSSVESSLSLPFGGHIAQRIFYVNPTALPTVTTIIYVFFVLQYVWWKKFWLEEEEEEEEEEEQEEEEEEQQEEEG